MISSEQKSANNTFFFAALFWGTVFGLILSVVLIFVTALLLTLTDMPESFTDVLVYACAAAGAMLSGFICAGRYKSKGLICGLFSGFVIFCVLLLTGLIVFGGVNFGVQAPIMLLVTLIPGAVGGILGVNA